MGGTEKTEQGWIALGAAIAAGGIYLGDIWLFQFLATATSAEIPQFVEDTVCGLLCLVPMVGLGINLVAITAGAKAVRVGTNGSLVGWAGLLLGIAALLLLGGYLFLAFIYFLGSLAFS